RSMSEISAQSNPIRPGTFPSMFRIWFFKDSIPSSPKWSKLNNLPLIKQSLAHYVLQYTTDPDEEGTGKDQFREGHVRGCGIRSGTDLLPCQWMEPSHHVEHCTGGTRISVAHYVGDHAVEGKTAGL